MRKLMDLKIDFAFKQMFGKEGNEPILIAFLNAALRPPEDQRIVEVEFLNPELLRETPDGKTSILDIYAKTKQNIHINVEIQVSNKYDMEKRTLYYWSRIFSSQLHKGDEYTDLTKTITINILNFRLFEETDRFHTTFHLYEDLEKFPLTDCLEIHFMELPKLMDKWEYHEVNPQENHLVRWLLLLEADNHEEIRNLLEAIAMEDPTIKKAFEVWEEFSRDERKWWEYESRRKAILDENSFKKGIERVVRKEIEKEFQQTKRDLEQAKVEVEQTKIEAEHLRAEAEQSKIEAEQSKIEAERAKAETAALNAKNAEIAKKLLDMKMDLAQIAQVTGLPLEMLQKLKTEWN